MAHGGEEMGRGAEGRRQALHITAVAEFAMRPQLLTKMKGAKPGAN